MLYKVFDFADKEASDVMVPRPDVVAISVDMPPEEALAAVLESPFTRYPVFRESLDEIVGILHVRDLFSALNDRGIAQVEIAELLRPAHFVPETKDLAALLAEFRRAEPAHGRRRRRVRGDARGSSRSRTCSRRSSARSRTSSTSRTSRSSGSTRQRIRIDGTFPIDDFNEQFGADLEHEDYHTVAGYVFDLLGRAALPGDEVRNDGMLFRVLETDGPRILRLEVEFGLEPPPAPWTEAAPAAWRACGPARGAAAPRARLPAVLALAPQRRGWRSAWATVAVGWQVYEINGDPLDLGLVGLAEFIPLPLLALPAGHLADRVPRGPFVAARLLDTAVLLALLGVTVAGPDRAVAVPRCSPSARALPARSARRPAAR